LEGGLQGRAAVGPRKSAPGDAGVSNLELAARCRGCHVKGSSDAGGRCFQKSASIRRGFHCCVWCNAVCMKRTKCYQAICEEVKTDLLPKLAGALLGTVPCATSCMPQCLPVCLSPRL